MELHMDLHVQIIGYYALIINVIAFLMYGIDKWKAKHNKYRIPEKTLLGVAALGGSIGAWSGMQSFRHKTKKNKFRIGVPCIMIVQAIIIGIYIYIR